MQVVDLKEGQTIKPCPFCQGKTVLFFDVEQQKYFASCVNELQRCTVACSTFPANSGEEAMKSWDDRHTIILN